MSELREDVRIVTDSGKLSGYLFVGADGLPELRLETQIDNESFRPATFPAAWRITSVTCGELYQAWREVEAIQMRLRVAQREAEQETPEPEDDITAHKRHRALEEETRGKE